MKKNDNDLLSENDTSINQEKDSIDASRFDEFDDEQDKHNKKKNKKVREKTNKQKDSPHDSLTKKKNKRTFMIVAIVIVFGLASFIVYYGLNKENYFDKYYSPGDTISSNELDIVFSEVCVATSFVDYPMDSNYVYVQAVYTITNNTDKELEWNSIPYLSLKKYTQSNKGYRYEEAEEGVFDYNALLSLSIERGFDFSNIKDNILPNETREIADVFKISASSFDIDNYYISFDNVKAIVNIGGTYDFTTETLTPSPQPAKASTTITNNDTNTNTSTDNNK